jgi:hypothetical protein
MDKPVMTDYVTLIFTLFDKFEQQMNQDLLNWIDPLRFRKSVSFTVQIAMITNSI